MATDSRGMVETQKTDGGIIDTRGFSESGIDGSEPIKMNPLMITAFRTNYPSCDGYWNYGKKSTLFFTRYSKCEDLLKTFAVIFQN
ncbi:MAG: hypothetical protein N2316_13435 [Spirochaetes bacterium]|nr:hypothetical protein [Spirochaetota bacterium]